MSAARPTKSGLVDLVAVRGCDRTFDALAARRAAPSDDPAVRLLASLVADVDADLPAARPHTAEPAPDEPRPALTLIGSEPRGNRRRGRRVGVRTALTTGVAAAVLATTGVAAGAIGYLDPVERALGIQEHSISPADQVRGALKTARDQIDHGEYAAARRTLAAARLQLAGVHGAEAAELASAIERVEYHLAHDAPVPVEGGATSMSPPARPTNTSATAPGSSADGAGDAAGSTTGAVTGEGGVGADDPAEGPAKEATDKTGDLKDKAKDAPGSDPKQPKETPKEAPNEPKAGPSAPSDVSGGTGSGTGSAGPNPATPTSTPTTLSEGAGGGTGSGAETEEEQEATGDAGEAGTDGG